jgi:hypothetical protein
MKIRHVFRVSLLEPYHTSTILRRTHYPFSPIKINGEHEYEIEHISDLRIFNREL